MVDQQGDAETQRLSSNSIEKAFWFLEGIYGNNSMGLTNQETLLHNKFNLPKKSVQLDLLSSTTPTTLMTESSVTTTADNCICVLNGWKGYSKGHQHGPPKANLILSNLVKSLLIIIENLISVTTIFT